METSLNPFYVNNENQDKILDTRLSVFDILGQLILNGFYMPSNMYTM